MTEIDEGQLQAFLDAFGISVSRSDDGRLLYSLSLTGEGQGSQSKRAYFDQQRRSWVAGELEPNRLTPPSTTLQEKTLPIRSNEKSWWDKLLPATEHTKLIAATDWSQTSLGPIELWPPSLRSFTSMCQSESLATFLFWGKDRIAIYNEAAVPLLGARHPGLMGGQIPDRWPDVADEFAPYFEEIERTGIGRMLQNFSMPLTRHGSTEETWWNCDMLPLREDNGTVGGYCFTWIEITNQVISDRFSRIVDEVGNAVDGSDREVWLHVQNVFGNYSDDITMCIIYSATNPDDGGHKLKLEATIGVKPQQTVISSTLDIESDVRGFAPLLRAALEKDEEFVLHETTSANFPGDVLENIEWQGYGEQSSHIAIIPVLVFNNLLRGCVVIGLNPRISMDRKNHQFLSDLSRRLGALFTNVTNAEQAKRREEKLIEDLEATEKRIRRMAELAPMGMYDLSAEGKLLWANTHFFDILGATGQQRSFKNFSWLEHIHPDDHEAANLKMGRSIIDQVNISDSLRLRKTWCSPDISGDQEEKFSEEPAWILYQAYPHIKDGQVESIMGCLTDISQFKWAESVQARSADAARAAKQRLEDFIDITSHEMRNPLSAVTQCADDILGSVSDAQRLLGNDMAVLEELHQIADTARSIALCATHQRRIIDDVLTLSKLDSALLSVVPVPSRPDLIVTDAMRMFAAEFASSGIQVDIVDESPGAFAFQEAAYCDSTRLMQVLVNLITNAIKFTRVEDIREVVIRYGAVDQPPDEAKYGSHFAWSSSTRKRRDLSSDIRYGEGTTVYLTFSVQDTGQGLPKNEAVHIFDKFIQANRRTYIKYGGSGLGLFISRELIELQGGKIGVSSETGKGSTFAFYVKAKRGVDLSIPPNGTHIPGFGSPKLGANDPNILKTAAVMAAASPQNGDANSSASQPSSISTFPDRASINQNLLLVEDNLVNQKVLARQLRKAGFTVVIANHGGEAVDRLLHIAGHDSEYSTVRSSGSHPIPFHCILMDWEMPVLDGLAATKRIRELEESGIIRPKQIIIGVTANARLEQIQMAEAAGMDEIVVKPFRVPVLIERIARATEKAAGTNS